MAVRLESGDFDSSDAELELEGDGPAKDRSGLARERCRRSQRSVEVGQAHWRPKAEQFRQDGFSSPHLTFRFLPTGLSVFKGSLCERTYK
jgi:hypothetical protein